MVGGSVNPRLNVARHVEREALRRSRHRDRIGDAAGDAGLGIPDDRRLGPAGGQPSQFMSTALM